MFRAFDLAKAGPWLPLPQRSRESPGTVGARDGRGGVLLRPSGGEEDRRPSSDLPPLGRLPVVHPEQAEGDTAALPGDSHWHLGGLRHFKEQRTLR